MNGWIRVSDKMPLRGESVVFAKEYPGPQEDGSERSAYSWHLGWFQGEWYDQGAHKVVANVTHWHPIESGPRG